MSTLYFEVASAVFPRFAADSHVVYVVVKVVKDTGLQTGGLSQTGKDVETPFRLPLIASHAVNDVAIDLRGKPRERG